MYFLTVRDKHTFLMRRHMKNKLNVLNLLDSFIKQLKNRK
jgi:hypothetical protein